MSEFATIEQALEDLRDGKIIAPMTRIGKTKETLSARRNLPRRKM